MTGLVLKLGPRERILINGAVIENGDRRSRLNIITPHANILRLKDAIHPHEVNTPVRRVCYVAQLVLSGDAEETEATRQLQTGISQLLSVLRDRDSQKNLQQALASVESGNFYRALKLLRGVLPREAQLLQMQSAP
ncbi:flagellar biosynthesis repressor FlbT [Fluviibacterium sp. S390]|uniref:flagellar biosynthesis repressor FlbT n=1 Tax=Fluviibacterium sp. S390 TaxID=3415139 RepID=UPI003C7B71B7